jgi:hypothetical protein
MTLVDHVSVGRRRQPCRFVSVDSSLLRWGQEINHKTTKINISFAILFQSGHIWCRQTEVYSIMDIMDIRISGPFASLATACPCYIYLIEFAIVRGRGNDNKTITSIARSTESHWKSETISVNNMRKNLPSHEAVVQPLHGVMHRLGKHFLLCPRLLYP